MSTKILQVHPTRRCNLRCLHCYSSSGPEQRSQLPLELLQQLVEDAVAEGYETLSVSGGEPLLYEHLPRLLERAHAHGMQTLVTTNGTVLRRRLLGEIVEHLDLLAISLDGVPASHNRMRASPRAFELLRQGVEEVRRLDLKFGFIFTLTQHNVNELRWVAQFAAQVGASLLQIHPLELVGRAATELSASRPDHTERLYAWLQALSIQTQLGDGVRVQLDLATIRALKEHIQVTSDLSSVSPQGPLASICSPLVLEPDGVLVPLTYGFPRHLAIGNITTDRLGSLAARWRSRYGQFAAHCRTTYERIESQGGLINWYEAVSM